MSQEDKEYKLMCSDLRELMKEDRMKRVIWHILNQTGLNIDCFTGDNHTFFLEGRRSVGLDIVKFMEDADATLYPRLLLDYQKLSRRDDNES
jgi:hypothetical protein